jgi:hypothetical protein
MPIPLVEVSESHATRKITQRVRRLGEVVECDVSMSHTRKKPSLHLHVRLGGNPVYEEEHRICSAIESEVRSVVANARVSIRSEPAGTKDTGEVWRVVQDVAEGQPGSRGVQSIHLRDAAGRLGVDLAVQVSSQMTPSQARDLGTDLERKLREADPRISEVVVHQEPVSVLVGNERSRVGSEVGLYVEDVVRRFREAALVRPPAVRETGGGLHVALQVALALNAGDDRAREVASELADSIKRGNPTVAAVEVVRLQGEFPGAGRA